MSAQQERPPGGGGRSESSLASGRLDGEHRPSLRRRAVIEPEFLVVSRAAIRTMLENRPDGIDGDDIGFLLLLAVEADDDDPTTFTVSSVRDLAAYFRLPGKRLRQRLHRLVDAGWIEWRPN